MARSPRAYVRGNTVRYYEWLEGLESGALPRGAGEALKTIPGVGALISTALAAHIPDPSMFRSGRDFAAWLGLVPRQNSRGGKERLGRIAKQAIRICDASSSSERRRACGGFIKSAGERHIRYPEGSLGRSSTVCASPI
jgi:transposase